MTARPWMLLVKAVAWTARRVPVKWGPLFDEMAQDLMKYGRYFKPMPRSMCKYDGAFYAEASCENIDCKAEWYVASLGNVDPETDLVCPVCEEASGAIA